MFITYNSADKTAIMTAGCRQNEKGDKYDIHKQGKDHDNLRIALRAWNTDTDVFPKHKG